MTALLPPVKVLELIDAIRSDPSLDRVVYVPPEELDGAHTNRSAGWSVKPGEQLPEHLSWDWLPASAKRSGTGLVFVHGTDSRGRVVSRLAVAPPFPISSTSRIRIGIEHLADFTQHDRAVALVDLHQGKSRIGIAKDARLLKSRTVSRYVRGRHRAGGQSANRFKRNRDAWQQKFNDKLADEVSQMVANLGEPIDWLAVAGDTHAARNWMNQTDVLARNSLRLLPRTFDSRASDRSALERLAREVWTSRIYTPPAASVAVP